MIGEKIKKFRESKNLSQEFVADYLGISQGAYSRIEKETVKLSAERISSLANLFEVPEAEFFPSNDGVVFNINNATYAYIHNFIEGQKATYEGVIEVLKQQLHESNQEKKTLLELLKDRQHQG